LIEVLDVMNQHHRRGGRKDRTAGQQDSIRIQDIYSRNTGILSLINEERRLIKFVNSHDIRKSIARTLTIINTTQRQQLRLFYKTKKYAPLDLRPKQTRAIRRRLSPTEAKIVTEKTKKRVMHFPQRRFAVKAA
jgi:hypothetical protein